MKLRNKERFWTGIAMGAFELLAIAIFALTVMDWSWLTLKVLVISAVALYNTIAGILIWNGSGRDKK